MLSTYGDCVLLANEARSMFRCKTLKVLFMVMVFDPAFR